MNLKTALDAFRAEFLEKFPTEKAAIMQRATDELTEAFQTHQFLQVGDLAPDFALTNAVGETVRLRDRLAQGAVISYLLSRWLVSLLQFGVAGVSAGVASNSGIGRIFGSDFTANSRCLANNG